MRPEQRDWDHALRGVLADEEQELQGSGSFLAVESQGQERLVPPGNFGVPDGPYSLASSTNVTSGPVYHARGAARSGWKTACGTSADISLRAEPRAPVSVAQAPPAPRAL